MKIKKKQGFASLSPERRKEISSLGGRTVHELGKRHTFTSAEARAAGKKGGKSRIKHNANPTHKVS